MAPNFLSKLVNKPATNNNNRDRSLSSPSPPSRSSTPSYVDNSSRNTSGFSSNTVSTGTRTNGASVYSSNNPSVAVIPPSPVVASEPTSNGDNRIDGLPATNNTTPRPPTPKKSPTSSPQMPFNGLPLVRRQSSASSKSVKLQELAPPVPPMPSAHTRAATSPASAPTSSSGHDEEEPLPRSIVDSPEALRPTDFPQTSPSSSISIPRAATRRDTDVLSVTSQGQKKKSTSRPWKRSTPKKPMGLAGAIAASGLAMANPAMTAPHQTTLSPQVMNTNEASENGPSLVTSPSANPRRKTISPESAHRRRRTGSNGHASPKDKPDHQRRRTTGGSVASHGEGGYFPEEHSGYYSGLDESSESGSGSDSDDESGSDLEDLDLGEEDIPVTGFAVASNKRNADFHELFPGIPEGDYLIDDYGCALQREILIQGRIYVSENHLCFHANIFGWVTDVLIPIYEITALEKKTTAFVIPNAIRVVTARGDNTFASFLSRDTTFDVIHNIWRLVRPSDAASIGSGSVGGPPANITEGTIIGAAAVAGGAAVQRKATQCACGKQGQHYKESAMDIVLPGTPDRIYNLMFASGFMKDFLAVNQKLLDIQVADWTPTTPGSKLLARNMSYIKPLNASIGPKQTKCEIRDENIHLDFDDYTSTITTTKNPDVPSGGVFSVKTRTCIMWATALSSKVVVTTEVEWTGRSFIKGIIESSAIHGQKLYHTDLEKAMRSYVSAHQTEFMPAGVDAAELAPPEPEAALETAAAAGADPSPKQRERERSQRGLQWAWDTFEGASNVAKQSTKGALELIHEAWEHSTWTTILYVLIVVLVISNVWTYKRMGKAMSKERKRGMELAKVDDKEQWVAGVVTALFDELKLGAPPSPEAAPSNPAQGASTGVQLKLELDVLKSTLDSVEDRVRAIRESLKEIVENLD